MDASTYGERVADRYDDEHGFLGSVEPQLALLAELAAPGNRVLELGIGTGRVALPLVDRGLAVTGIDTSPKMLARLAAKPGGDKVSAVLGDMGDVGVSGEFDLIFCVVNTFWALLTQEAQIACLTRAATRLAPGGKLLIEASVPDPSIFARGQAWRTRVVGDDRVVAEASRHDPHHSARRHQPTLLHARPPSGHRADPHSLRPRVRTRSDGARRWPRAARAMGGMEPGAVRPRRVDARVRVHAAHCLALVRNHQPRYSGSSSTGATPPSGSSA